MMANVRLSSVAVVIGVSLGCSWFSGSTPVPTTPDASGAPVDVVAVANAANAIKADPADADAILSDAGFTRESFEAALFQIARNPDWSDKYEGILR